MDVPEQELRDEMSLADAITHADEVGAACGPCAAEHRQLAAWLRELQQRRAQAGAQSSRSMTEDKVQLCQKFAAGRPTSRALMVGPTLAEAQTRHFPALAGRLVRNVDDPQDGYPDASSARAAAGRYRESCRDALAAFPAQ